MTTHKIYAILVAFLSVIYSQAAIIYVDKDATGLNNGNNWANAYDDLHDALAAATNGDEIWVADGIYKPTSTNDNTIYFEVTVDVDLYGGFNGTETTRGQRNWNDNPTRLNGEIGNQAIDTDNSNHIIVFDGVECIFDGFFLEQAYNNYSNVTDLGTVRILSSDMDIRHCIFRNNSMYQASGLSCDWSTIQCNNCLFRDNHNDAGSICRHGGLSHGTYTNCTFTQNDFVQTFGSCVGGIVGSTTSSYNCIFYDNDELDPFGSTTDNSNYCLIDVLDFTSEIHSNRLNQDPQFVNPGSNNFQLSASSPCIGYGDNIYSTLNRDLDHNNRIWNGQIDIGCFERANERTIYVDVSAVGNDNGTTWADAFNSVQDAIVEANSTDTIWVANGIYYPTSGTDRSISIEPQDGAPMYGGFAGGETDISERDWVANETIFSGNIGGILNLADNSYHVVKCDDPNGDFVLDGFIIQWGNADGVIIDDNAAGVYVADANSFKMEHCWVRFNNAIGPGGGLWIFQCTEEAEIINTAFTSNIAHAGSAVLFNPDTYLENCAFRNNDGQSLIENNAFGVLTMVGCTATENNGTFGALIQGSGGGTLEGSMTNSIIWGNTITSDDAVENDFDFQVSYSILQGNTLSPLQEGAEVYYDDPLFVDPANADYSLCPSSAGFDNGDMSVVTTERDVLGNERIGGPAVDFGAVEQSSDRELIYVDVDAIGAADGTSWADAYTDIQSAIAAAGCVNEIWVAEGSYFASYSNNRDEYISVNQDLEIYGGFNGTETLRGQRDWAAHQAIISGEIGVAGETDNSKNLMRVDLGVNRAVIDGFIFELSYNDPLLNATAGALIAVDGSTTVNNCVFRHNTGHLVSGILVSQGFLRCENSLFYENHTELGGTIKSGTILASMEIVGCTFANNTHANALAHEIGGSNGISLEVYNTIIWGNDQGTIDLQANETVSHCLIEGGFPSGTNIVDQFPVFQSPPIGDFRVLGNSPAIDVGDPVHSTLSEDLGHESRIWNLTIDIGCHEFRTSNIIYVDLDATGSNDGTTWADAFTDLQDGLAAHTAGTEIWISEGTYTPSQVGDRTASFEIPHGALIRGGFSGTELHYALRDIDAHFTYLSGNIGDPLTETDNSYHVVTMDGVGTAFLEVLHIVEGYANGTNPDNLGAGLYATESQYLLIECNFLNNHSDFLGGAVYNDNTDPANHVVISDCHFESNHAEAWGCMYAGPVGSVNMSYTKAINNTATASPGFLFNQSVGIYNCEFTGNVGGGPLLDIDDANPTSIEDCLFENNESTGLIGLMSFSGVVNLDIEHCEISGNTSAVGAPLIRTFSGDATIENTLIADNTGGGEIIALYGLGSMDIVNTTIANNHLDMIGPLSTIIEPFDNVLNLGNSILWDNEAHGILAIGAGTVVQDCIIQGGAPGVNVQDIDPNFIDPLVGDYHINANSPAYNAGDQSLTTALTDLDDLPRVVDGDIDLGCYEAQSCDSPHDLCDDAIHLVLDADPVYGNNRCADDNGDPITACTLATGRTVWYEFTAPATGQVDVITTDFEIITPVANMRIAAYEGACGALNEIACADETASDAEQLSLEGLTAGSVYRIRIDGVGTQEFDFKIQVLESGCLGDYNNDGQINTADLLQLLGEFGCSSGCVTDLNGDDQTDTSDLLSFLGLFGTSCD